MDDKKDLFNLNESTWNGSFSDNDMSLEDLEKAFLDLEGELGDLDELKEISESIEEIKECLSDEVFVDKDGKDIISEEKGTYVQITEDKKEAWLYLARPENKKSYSKEEVIRLLENNGVRTGYIVSNIMAMVRKGIYERSIKVAMSTEPEEGKEGYYHYEFDVDSLTMKNPKIKEDGSVDYSSVNLLVGVAKDSKICTYHKAVEGKEGYLVDGTVLSPKRVADLPVLKGRGFRYDEETGEYFSEIDGKLDFKDTYEIIISNTHHIKGDVTQLNPRIEFNGDIEIDGNVENGAIIRSTRTITISGVVEAAEIYAGGDIVLKRGIQGSNKAKIVCNGTVYADFIEHTVVKAKKDVKANTILNSEISADGEIVLTGKRGTLVGGYSHGRKGITCVNLGNSVEVKTVAHVGLETRDYLKNQEVKKKDAMLRERLKAILDRMSNIMAERGIRQLKKEEILELSKLNSEKKELMHDLENNKRDEEIINVIVEESRDAKIRVEEHVYKGVIIAIDATRIPIMANTQYMIYEGVNGVIESSVIVV